MEAIKPNITLEDIGDKEKMDVRICRIVGVSDILRNPKKERSDENTVKAYHLDVDTGGERRDIVTNIVDKYTKEDLLDKEVAFILNLEPTQIRGVLSRGMIFLNDSGGLITGKMGEIV